MATVVFSRGKRATPPPMPRGDLLLESPPKLGYGIVNPTRAVFGPFAETATTPTPRASASGGPLAIPPDRDTGGMLVAVVVTLGVLVLLFGALLIREALGPMRARNYTPARPDE